MPTESLGPSPTLARRTETSTMSPQRPFPQDAPPSSSTGQSPLPSFIRSVFSLPGLSACQSSSCSSPDGMPPLAGSSLKKSMLSEKPNQSWLKLAALPWYMEPPAAWPGA
jgi:hypothetical protein